MYKDVYRRCDGTFHSRIYYDKNGTRYMSRSFNEQGDLFSICNFKGNVFHGKVTMYNQGKDIKEDINRGIQAAVVRNTVSQQTWYYMGSKCTKEEFNKLTKGNT
jgi:hypothetical protein